MPKGKPWSAEFKAKVVLETLKEDETIAQVASAHDLNPKVVSRWRAEFIDHADRVFAEEKEAKARERELAEHRAEVDDLHRMIGEITAERDHLQRRVLERFGVGIDKPQGPDRPGKQGWREAAVRASARLPLERVLQAKGGATTSR